jgi:hypothetical protein
MAARHGCVEREMKTWGGAPLDAVSDVTTLSEREQTRAISALHNALIVEGKLS